jgi:SAM-dependent methyltransferase
VLDLGCGTGASVGRLARCGYRAIGLDLRPEGLAATRRAFTDAALVRAGASPLPFDAGVFDAAVLLDVLEHVDDTAVLAEVHRVLRPGAAAVITVPALPWLWSHRDEAAGHRRRYTRPGLVRALRQAGFAAVETRYYQCLLLPLAILTRRLGRRGPRLRDLEDRPPAALNAVLAGVNLLEAKLGRFIRWPWGSTLVAVGRKECA